jgi:hypothetical protein
VKAQQVHFPPGFQPIGSKKTSRPITQRVSTYFRHFQFGFPQHSSFIKLNEKLDTLKKNLKTISSSSPIFALSNNAAFGQTQTSATIPLKKKKD